MKYFLLLLAAHAAVSLVPSLPTNSKFCIQDCSCKFGKLPSRLQITYCSKPLVLNASTFRYINKAVINTISLENLIINQIQETAFSEFTDLDDVVVLNTSIGSIDAKAFNNVTRLKFQNCRFEDSPDLFSEKLEEIHFGSCNLYEIPNLNSFFNLNFLNLTGNFIKNIEVEAFAELFTLEELYLSNNEIFKLPPTSFINNQQLIILNLDNNPLKRFSLNTSDSLETLSLKNCQLESFDEESTRRLTLLNELVLSYNNIRNISSKAFSHMPKLSVVDLSYNKLTKLDADVFATNSKLIKITLDGNNLQTLPAFYLKNEEDFSIYTFSCKFCNLKTLSSSVFEKMEGIINLVLSHNKFMNVDNIFDKISSLKLLDISHNNIAYISPQTFVNNQNLETLNIAGNPLMALNPEDFSNNVILREIDARNCSMRKIWSNHNKSIKSLHKILLSGNQLNTLTEDDVKVMPKLEAIELDPKGFYWNYDLCQVIQQLEMKNVILIEYVNNTYPEYERTFGEDIDGFTTVEWKTFHGGNCPDHITAAPTKSIEYETTKFVPVPGSSIEKLDYNDTDGNDDDEDESDEYNDENYNYEDETVAPKFMKEETSLARATYILSITSVFVLSALVVLTIAVTFTLCILRRNNPLELQRANIPRLRFLCWNTEPGQKTHSGSVYKILSNDLSGPKTPKLSRYEFTTTPVVHTA